jgi:hypothetical protein
LKTTRKRLIIGFALLAVLDLAGFITMFVNPELTERVIPALVGVQLLGFAAIAAIVVTGKRELTSVVVGNDGLGMTGKGWVPWLFGFLALLSFLRVGLALLYIAGEEGHKHSWFSPIAGAMMGGFFLWLAIKSGREQSKGQRSPDI